MSHSPSTNVSLVAKDAPPVMSASRPDHSSLPNRLLTKDVPQSPGSDEGFVSGFFPSMSSTTSSITPSSITPSNSSWKGNFRSSFPIDSQTPVLSPTERRKPPRKNPPTVTICPSETSILTSASYSSNFSSINPDSTSSPTAHPNKKSTEGDADSQLLTNDSGAFLTQSDYEEWRPRRTTSPLNSSSNDNSRIDSPKDISTDTPANVGDEPEISGIDYFQVDEDLVTPLHVAVLDDVDASFFLISKAESPAQLNMHNKFGSSPIHLAAMAGNSTSLRDLILGGANVAERDAQGETALHIACRKGHLESVRCLTTPLSMDDQVITSYEPPYQRLPQRLDIVNYDGLTALHLASIHRHKEVIRELVRLGADVDCPEAKSGRTPLHFAAEKKDTEIVRYLYESCKADVDSETFDGATALCLAEGRGFNSMARILRGYGADTAKGIQAWRRQEESDYGSDFDSGEEPWNSSCRGK